jgi:hypothetical protein
MQAARASVGGRAWREEHPVGKAAAVHAHEHVDGADRADLLVDGHSFQRQHLSRAPRPLTLAPVRRSTRTSTSMPILRAALTSSRWLVRKRLFCREISPSTGRSRGGWTFCVHERAPPVKERRGPAGGAVKPAGLAERARTLAETVSRGPDESSAQHASALGHGRAQARGHSHIVAEAHALGGQLRHAAVAVARDEAKEHVGGASGLVVV